MNIKQITEKFGQTIKWNALFYGLRKALSTFLTIALFKKLSLQDFSIWANIYSAIFFTLLWLDFGFRKSLPRYCPEFAKNKIILKKFITIIILFQALVLASLAPFFLILSVYLTKALGFAHKIELFYLGCALFVLEGILSIIRLIYYSQFWQRQFNLQMSVILVLKTLVSISAIFYLKTSYALVKSIFFLEALSAIVAISVHLVRLKPLYKNNLPKEKPQEEPIDFKKTMLQFVKHSLAMWISNNIKSLTERNFMQLFITKMVGPYPASLFKMANDGALIFYRTVIKTIGTTDTSLLAYVESDMNKEKTFPLAFRKLIHKIINLVIPLFGILIVIFIHFKHKFSNNFIFHAFIFLACCYLLEFMFSPYERVLEVKKRYYLLALAHIPYIFAISLILLFVLAKKISLLQILFAIHIARLTTLLILQQCAKRMYRVVFPIKKTSKALVIVGAITLFASLLMNIFLR